MEDNTMKCKECGSFEDEFDDRMGELVCIDCGFVKDVHIYETRASPEAQLDRAGRYLKEKDTEGESLGSWIQPSHWGYHNGMQINHKLTNKLRYAQKMFRNKKDASVNRGYMECNMVLSPYLPNKSLKTRVHSYYKTLYYQHAYKGFTLSVRACAVVLICLREDGVPITIAEIAEKNGEEPHTVSKCCRLLARKLGRSSILHSMPINPWTERVAHDIVIARYGHLNHLQEWQRDARYVVDYIHNKVTENDIHFSKSYMATSFWIVSMLRRQGHPEVTQQQVCDACNCTPVALRKVSGRLFDMLKVDKDKLTVLTVEQFISGVRYA